jgi:PhnB protein
VKKQTYLLKENGIMIKPYLMFNRECDEAFKLYQKAFNGEMVAIHAELKITESGYILGSDYRQDLQSDGKVCISVELNSEESASKAWNVLKDNGTVHMDLQPTFFAKLHGSVKDKFGVTWMFTVS